MADHPFQLGAVGKPVCGDTLKCRGFRSRGADLGSLLEQRQVALDDAPILRANVQKRHQKPDSGQQRHAALNLPLIGNMGAFEHFSQSKFFTGVVQRTF